MLGETNHYFSLLLVTPASFTIFIRAQWLRLLLSYLTPIRQLWQSPTLHSLSN